MVTVISTSVLPWSDNDPSVSFPPKKIVNGFVVISTATVSEADASIGRSNEYRILVSVSKFSNPCISEMVPAKASDIIRISV